VPAQNNEERLDRLELIVQELAVDQHAAETAIAELATATRIAFDQVAEQFRQIGRRMDETAEHMRETDQHMRETDQHMRETDRRMRQTDERIDKLVLAIGELIRRDNPAQ
jgi:methyl-accepting chemotaxis protein